MNEQNCRILNLIGATILLLAVSAYRQLSIRYLQGDFVRPYIVYAVYIFLLLNWQYFISTKITQKMMSFHLTAQNIVCIFYITVRFVQDAFLYVNVQLMRFTGYFIYILVVLGPLFGLCYILGADGESLKISGMVMWCDGVPDEFKKASYRGGTDTGSAGFAGGNQYGHDWKN